MALPKLSGIRKRTQLASHLPKPGKGGMAKVKGPKRLKGM